MRKIDDTPVPESESELTLDVWFEVMDRLEARIEALELRLANLETRKNWQSHQEENDDPEWYA